MYAIIELKRFNLSELISLQRFCEENKLTLTLGGGALLGVVVFYVLPGAIFLTNIHFS